MSEQIKLDQTQAALLASVSAVEAEIAPTITHDENGQLLPEPESIESAAAENTAILGTLIALLSPAMPFLNDCYPPDVVQRIATAYTAVEEKYGWAARKHLGVEVQLAIVAIPPSIMAYMMGKEFFKAKREAQEAAEQLSRAGDGRTE